MPRPLAGYVKNTSKTEIELQQPWKDDLLGVQRDRFHIMPTVPMKAPNAKKAELNSLADSSAMIE